MIARESHQLTRIREEGIEGFRSSEPKNPLPIRAICGRQTCLSPLRAKSTCLTASGRKSPVPLNVHAAWRGVASDALSSGVVAQAARPGR